MKDVKITITSSDDLRAALANQSRIGKFGNYKVWDLDSSDLQAAANAINSGDVDGISISPSCGYKLNDLNCLADLPKFHVLVTTYPEKLDVSYVEHMPHLICLSLGEGQTVKCDLNVMQNLQYLYVTIGKNQKLPTQLMPNLKDLSIWNMQGIDAEDLQVFPNICRLQIIQARKLISLTGLESCSKLTELVVAYCPKLEDINTLQKLTSLINLDLQNVKSLSDYSAIEKLKQLNKLMIDKAGVICDLNFIKNLEKLNHLVIRSTPIESCDFSPLLNLPVLSHIYMDKKREYEPIASELEILVASRKK
jgi:hypothetical protein